MKTLEKGRARESMMVGSICVRGRYEGVEFGQQEGELQSDE
jgi:hypothetical protein